MISSTLAQFVSAALAVGFCCAACFSKARTYNVLAFFSLINAGIHWLISAVFFIGHSYFNWQYSNLPDWSIWWQAIYGSLDLLAIIFILRFGSIHKIYQVSLLILLVTLHLGLGIDNWLYTKGYNVNLVFDLYFPTILMIMIAQMLGAFCGNFKSLRIGGFVNMWRKRHIHAHINNKSRS